MTANRSNRFTGLNIPSTGTPGALQRGGETSGINTLQGVYIAKVVDNADENYQGHIWVELVGHQSITGTDTMEARHDNHKIRTMSPFGGSIQGGNYTSPYGASFPPPTPGSEVLVAFTGREQEGVMLGVLPDANRNASVPGIPAGPIEGEEGTIGPSMDAGIGTSNERNTRPRAPVAAALAEQGIGLDPVGGIGSSGGRRESPSNVSGFLSPGGHSFVMDDGTTAHQEGINHVPDRSREAGSNNLIRIRSGSGAQFLINDSAGIVYIINQSGSSWVQMDSSGNVDIYAQGSVSMHAETDFNFYAGGDFNLDADSININARGDGIKMASSTGDINLYATQELRLTADTNMHLKAKGNMRLSTDGMLDLNGPPATPAEQPESGSIAVNRGVKESINPRVPEHEPWGGHGENDNRVAAQAPSANQTSTKDFDVSGPIGTNGAGG